MQANLSVIHKIITKNKYLQKQFGFNFLDAELIAEFHYGDQFYIYHSLKSANYLLFHYQTDYLPSPESEVFLKHQTSNFSLHHSFSDLLLQINSALTNKHKEEFNMHTKHWHSSLPPWLNLYQTSIKDSHKDIILQEIVKAEENTALFSKEEIAHIQFLKLNLQVK